MNQMKPSEHDGGVGEILTLTWTATVKVTLSYFCYWFYHDEVETYHGEPVICRDEGEVTLRYHVGDGEILSVEDGETLNEVDVSEVQEEANEPGNGNQSDDDGGVEAREIDWVVADDAPYHLDVEGSHFFFSHDNP